MSLFRISVDSELSGQTTLDQVGAVAGSVSSFARLGELIRSIAIGIFRGKIRFNGNSVPATGTVTFSSFVADDTVTVNGVVFVGKASPSSTLEFAIGSADQDCANNFAAKINASALDKIVGVVGAIRRATVAISAMVANDTVTVNGVVFTCTAAPTGSDQRQFALGTSDAGTANNLMIAIRNAAANQFSALLNGITVTLASLTLTLEFNGTLTVSNSAHATVVSTIAVVTALIPGQIGNLCTLAISAHGSVSGANLSGGTEGTEVIFSKNSSAL